MQNKIDNECLCPILTGVSLIDDFKKVELLKEINFFNVSYPLLLVPFISRLSVLIGKRVSINIDEHIFRFNLDKYIDYDRQFEKSFLDPMKGILETIGWDYERKSTIMDIFS